MTDQSQKLQRASNSSDAAKLLQQLAEQLILAAERVTHWATMNEPANLDEIAAAIDKAYAELREGLSAQSAADLPTLQQLEWKVKVLESVCDRKGNALSAHPFPGPVEWDDKYKELHTARAEAYAAYLAALRELRAHPDWLPKKKRKRKT
jgi:hypothetical protein